jgi:hypothetical protein
MKMFKKMLNTKASETESIKEGGFAILLTAIYFFISQFFFLVSYSKTLAKNTFKDIFSFICSMIFSIIIISKNTAVDFLGLVISCAKLVVSFPFILIFSKIKEIGNKKI